MAYNDFTECVLWFIFILHRVCRMVYGDFTECFLWFIMFLQSVSDGLVILQSVSYGL